MRESARNEKTHLPRDAYEEWLRSRKRELRVKGRGKKVTEDYFEAWLAKRVEKQLKKTSARVRRR